MTMSAAPKKIYASLNKPTHTFTLYNDEMSHLREYTSWTVEDGTRNCLSEDLNAIHRVVLDESMKDAEPQTTSSWFAKMSYLTTIENLDYLNTSKVTRMDSMFYKCRMIESLDLSAFNVQKVRNMNSMMEACNMLAIVDISSFDLHTGDGWEDVSSKRMFADCWNLRVIFSNDKDLYAAPTKTYSGKDMFLGCRNLRGGNGTAYDPGQTGVSYGIYDSEDHPGYFTCINDSPEPLLYALLSADSTALTIRYDKQLGPNRGMADWSLYNNEKYNLSGSRFAIEKIILDESVKAALPKSTAKFFYSFEHLTEIENLACLNTANSTDMSFMFAECSKLASLKMNFNTPNVTTMAGMFKKCEALKELNFDAGSFNTEKVTDMSEMFSYCNSLQSLNLESFNTGQVTTMKKMFESCNLKQVDMRSFDFSNVRDVSRMFFLSTNIETIYCNSDLSKLPDIEESKDLFGMCLQLTGGAGTSFLSVGGGGIAYAHPDAEGNPGFFTSTIESKTAELYGKLSPDGSTLTICYDKKRPIVGGRVFWSVYNNNPPNENAETNHVTKVVMDETMKDFKPATTAGWFADFRYLKTIVHLDYLNTSEVTNMSIMFARCDSLVDMSVSGFDTKNVTNMSGMFAQCGKLRKLDVSKFNTSNVTNMNAMFYNCRNLTGLDVSNFDTRNVTDMSFMFYKCEYAYPINVSNFDTRNVTDMSYMFSGCKNETCIDVSRFNTSNVTNMEYMFADCKNLGALDLRSFDVSQVTKMGDMFAYDSSLYYLYANQDWSTIAPLEKSDIMFWGCPNLRGGAGTVYNESNLSAAYARPDEGEDNPGYFTAVAEIYATWDADNTTLTLRFDNKREENGGTTNWAVYNYLATRVVFDASMKKAEPTSTKDWFYGFSQLETIEHLDYLSTYGVKDMSYMFAGCSSLTTLNVNSFYLSWAQTTEGMFSYCINLATIWCDHNWNEQLYDKNSKDMFLGCTSLVGGKGTTYSDSYTNASRACTDSNLRYGYFTAIPEGTADLSGNELYAVLEADNKTLTIRYDKQRISRGGVADWYPYSSEAGSYHIETIVLDPSVAGANPTSTEGWFGWFSDLTTITGLEYLNTEYVTDMTNMFRNCSSLTGLDVTSFNTQNVTKMGFMFSGCTSLKALDLSHFDTRKVSIMYNMFENCESLTELDIRQFETDGVTDMTMLFYNCKNLEALDVTALKTGNVTAMTGMFAGCGKLTSLDVSGFDMSSIVSLMGMFYGCTSLKTIYCNDDWSKLPSLAYHNDLFTDCPDLVGGNNTVYSADNANDVSFAHVGEAGNPGYFTTNITYQVTLTAENGKIDVEEKEIDLTAVPKGTVLHFTAIPDNGYELNSWTGYNGKELVVNGDKEVTAHFALQTFTVRFTDWNDGLIKEQTVEWGKAATAPEDPVRTDYLFVGWTPADFSTVYEDMTVKAQYEEVVKYFTVTLVAGNGTITVEEEADLAAVENGTVLHLTATPDYGYTFDHWENYDPGTGLLVTGDITVTAYFVPKIFTLTVVAEPAEGGTFLLGGVDENRQGTYMSDYTIEAVPAGGYEFVEWRDGNEVLDNKTTKMSGALYGNVTITGVFQLKTYTVTVTVNDEAMGSVMGSGEYVHGSTVQVGAFPKTGYKFVKWSNGETDNPLFFTVTADTEIQAIFLPVGTGLDEVVNRQSSIRKYIIDGVLYIERNGKTYSVQGQRVK